MSKIKRKITVNLSTKGKGSIPKTRPSVFERLGTKATNTGKEYCHHWAQSGSCPYGKGCKYSSTHTLISPSKQRAAKTQRRHIKDGHKRVQQEEWDQWDPEELEDADPDDLERKRQELQRELELQMKMESKAKKKDKKKESSQSSETSSSTTDSTTSSDDSSSSSTSSADAKKRKLKKTKTKRSSSTSSEERGRIKHKSKTKRSSKSLIMEKGKKVSSKAVKTKSVSPTRQRKKSETPPIKSKASVTKKLSSEKSPRPQSRSSNKEKHRTPSPKPKDKEREKEREREREREREKEREKEREREKEKEREREKEKERERAKERAKEREREKEKEHKKKESNRSPKRDNRSGKDVRNKRDTPDPVHTKERKPSPGRGKGNIRKDHKSPLKDDRRSDRRDDRDRSRGKDARLSDRSLTRKDIKHDSRDRDRERDREKERRLAREREEAREKEREEALARCQERQRERERLKKEEEQRRRDRTRREDRGLDKPSGDRVERLLPPLEERVPPSRKGHSSERGDRDRGRGDGRGRDRTPDRSLTRKSPDRRGGNDMNKDRSYDRGHERDYVSVHRDKDYDSPYDRGRQHDDRRYLDVDVDHYDDRMYGNSLEDRRSRRDMWDDMADVEMDHRLRYGGQRDDLKSNRAGDWIDHQHSDYPEHDWDRNNRRALNPDWDTRDNWDSHKQVAAGGCLEEEWRHYNRSMEAWNNEDRRRWQQQDWRERSRPRSAASHHHVETMSVPPSEDSNLESNRKKEVSVVVPQSTEESSQVKLDIIAGEEDANRSTPASQKRPIDESLDSPGSSKKLCVKSDIMQPALEDDLSEISDDADDILNRDEDIPETNIEESTETQGTSEPSGPNAATTTEQTSVASQKSSQTPPGEQSRPQSPATAAATNNKGGSIDEDHMELDFEEISEDELEEESKMKGLVDALGVDWSSLVAESKPRTKPSSSAKIKWEAHNVLVNLGVSVQLAGEDLVKLILKEHADAKMAHQNKEVVKSEMVDVKVKIEPDESITNGVEANVKIENAEVKIEPTNMEDINVPESLAAIQVADRERSAIRKSLFTNVGPHRRALAARRDLTIRRHLCNLPITDKHVEVPKRYDPDLFQLASQLLERSL
ncbi:fl(2)d-associated complex component-like [Diorhabda carinulata]|uniref:fl(2)d-associated complex component-like n=1 Tax=Diorhabda carinulata TaxID=1163345 RepID=UPI0025A0BFFE|nr:fl(2)d-associated complex component-like [Diorhabda carinulata]